MLRRLAAATTFALLATLLAPLGHALALPIPVVLTPVNDDFSAATALPSQLPVSASGTNGGASVQAGEPMLHGGATGATVWWSWTAPVTGRVLVSTAGSDFDTALGVYTGSTLATLTQLGHDDDGGPSHTSAVALHVTAGQVYRIQVDGYIGGSVQAQGSIKLAVVALDGILIGTVRGPDGEAVGNVCVEAEGAYIHVSAATTPNGALEAEVPSGTYDVVLNECGPANLAPAHVSLTVLAGPGTPFTVTMARGARLSGHVTVPSGINPTDVEVWAQGVATHDIHEVSPAADGSFLIDRVATDSYVVHATYYDTASHQQALYYGMGSGGPGSLPVTAGCEVTGLDVDLVAMTIATPVDGCVLAAQQKAAEEAAAAAAACASATTADSTATALLATKRAALAGAQTTVAKVAKQLKRAKHHRAKARRIKKKLAKARAALKADQSQVASAQAASARAAAARSAACA